MPDGDLQQSSTRTPKAPPELIGDKPLNKKETDLLKQRFLDEYPKWGTLYHTCKALGMGETRLKNWRDKDPEFKERLMQVEAMPIYAIERSAMRRAIEGKSDLLSIFFLKSRMPERYGERAKQEIEITIHHVLTAQFVALIRQTVPDHCPHCKNYLGLTTRIAEELGAMSARLDPEGTIRGSPQQITAG
jgi:hypothetical protein